jgi:hypothetical protein
VADLTDLVRKRLRQYDSLRDAGTMTPENIASHARICAQQCRNEGHFDVAGGFDEIARMAVALAAAPTPHGGAGFVTGQKPETG